MRWKKPDGTYVTDKNKIPNKSTAEIFYNSYIQAMKNYKGKDIRILGHSLGNQMATRLVKLVSDNIDNKNIDKNLMPKRLVLLDPFWSRWKKDYLNDKWTGEVCREYIKDLVKKDLIVEMYKSSILTGFLAGDENTPLKKLVCYTELKPLYANSWNLSKKHHAAVNYYLLSIGLLNNYPQEMVNNKISNIKAPSASTSNEITKSRMGNGNWWKQQSNDGAYTIPSIDDVFERIQW